MSFLIGLFSGLFGGLVGLGGGVIMIPLMVAFFKFDQHQAHGTSLMALVFTGLSGAITYYLKGSVDVLAAAVLAAAAIFTARFGAVSANALPECKLQTAFGIFVICVSILLVSKPCLSHLAVLSHPAGGWQKIAVLLASGAVAGFLSGLSHPAAGWSKIAALLASGAVAGFLSGMMGVGGGSIMVPALVLMVGHSQYTAQGSSLLAMVPGGSVGAYTHWRLGNVVLRVLTGLVPGILIGTYFGGNLAHLLSEANLRLIFAAVLIWLGLRDIRSAAKKRLLAEARAKAEEEPQLAK
ncbi:MAG: sulfite exporter TauE/SafE family protein [Deltaproteobacteria bacterium]|nr:sulfite exporter TauE/SafE family protein [Deltaproteobacteria bacterium]